MSRVLGLTKRTAVSYLDGMTQSIKPVSGRDVEISLNDSISVGDGDISNFDGDVSLGRVGVADIAGNSLFSHLLMIYNSQGLL